jgi:GTP-binding protein Era
MVKVVNSSVTDVDAVALVVEPIPNVGTQERLLIEKIKANDIPAILVINKVDTLENKEDIFSVISEYVKACDFQAVVPISAKTGDGIEDVLQEFEKFGQEGPQLFPDGMVTDQPEKQIIAEIIREKLLLCLEREIPHGTAVEVTKFSERDNGVIDLDVTIYCEKDSHKGMIIGKGGAMLKKIGQLSREDIEKFMGTKVFMQTWVKVKENWRDSAAMIKNFGYECDN